MKTYSLVAQIEEVSREIAMRERVYPQMVRARKMSADAAEIHIGRMRSVLRTLMWLRDNEAEIKARHAGGGE